MKKIKYIAILVLFIISLLIIIIVFTPVINKKIAKHNFENNIKSFLNESKINENIVSDGIEWISYAKSNNVNNYDISDFVENYYDLIVKSIQAKKNGTNIVTYGYAGNEYNYIQYDRIVDIYKGLTIHGLNDYQASFIINCITDKDIDLYNSNKLKVDLFNRLEKILTRNGNNWFISGNENKHIELPYNVYLEYISNKKENVNKVKYITDIEIMNNNLDDISTSEILPIKCRVKYINNKNEKQEETIYLKFADNENKVLSMVNLGGLYYKNQNRATLTAGQHDYDEALIKEKEWEAEIGLNGDMSYLNVNGNIDKEEKETEHYLTDEEFEKVFKGINKKYGIE